MLNLMDRFWIARGISPAELYAIKGRSFLYAGLMGMAAVSVALSVGILNNVAGELI